MDVTLDRVAQKDCVTANVAMSAVAIYSADLKTLGKYEITRQNTQGQSTGNPLLLQGSTCNRVFLQRFIYVRTLNTPSTT